MDHQKPSDIKLISKISSEDLLFSNHVSQVGHLQECAPCMFP
jgi:hypothetical protein